MRSIDLLEMGKIYVGENREEIGRAKRTGVQYLPSLSSSSGTSGGAGVEEGVAASTKRRAQVVQIPPSFFGDVEVEELELQLADFDFILGGRELMCNPRPGESIASQALRPSSPSPFL